MDYVTIIKAITPARIRKEFRRGKDGQLTKTSAGALIEGRAKTVRIGPAHEMSELLALVTEKDDIVIMLGAIDGAEEGAQFTIVTERRLAQLMNCSVDDVPGGIVDINGKPYAARLKRGIRPSRWVLVDADNPEGMPDHQRDWDIQKRTEYLEPIIPGISTCERVELCSSSARIVKEGHNSPRPATHALIRVTDPQKIDILREHVRVEMRLQDLCFESPRYSRETGAIIGQSARTVVDTAVWVPGHLMFVARPFLDADGYAVTDAKVCIVNAGAGALDLSSIVLPDAAKLDALREKTGDDLSYSRGGSFSVKDHSSLSWNTPIEVRGETLTLREVVADMHPGEKRRCEAPFRSSKSEAAFIRIMEDGLPMVHDVGTGTSYFLPFWEQNGLAQDPALINLAEVATAVVAMQASTETAFGAAVGAALPPILKPSVAELLADPKQILRDRRLPVPNLANISTVLSRSQDWDGVFAYDEFSDEIMVLRPILGTRTPHETFKARRLREADILNVQVWMQGHGFRKVAKQTVFDAIALVAGENVISPVRHYLEEVAQTYQWSPETHQSLLHRLCADYFGAAEDPSNPGSDPKYLRAVGLRFMVAAVARAFAPGCQVDSMLVLEGAQGQGKSSAVAVLFGSAYFSDSLPQIGTKDANDHLRGKWCIEISELSAMTKADIESTKAFISRRVERYRRPYDRAETEYPRRCVFIGTTNQDTYLRDETGNRRFWPVRVGKIDLAALTRDRDILWAEAVYWYRQDKKWHMPASLLPLVAAVQESRVSADIWQDVLWRAFDGQTEVSLQEAADKVGLERARSGRAEQNRLSACLKALGFEPRGKLTSGPYRNSARYVRAPEKAS